MFSVCLVFVVVIELVIFLNIVVLMLFQIKIFLARFTQSVFLETNKNIRYILIITNK